MSFNVVIISEYEAVHKSGSTFFIESHVVPCCPVCGEPLIYRGRCKRIRRLEGGGREVYIIRRLQCPKCHTLHRELPDILVPYKQYGADIISGVLDDVVGPEDEDSEDYPCETTMERWKRWLNTNSLRIDGYLKSVGHRQLGFSESLLNSHESLLGRLRKPGERWLESILKRELTYQSPRKAL